MGLGSELSQFSVPPVGLNLKTLLLNGKVQFFKVLFTSRTTNELTDSGNQHVHSLHGLSVRVSLHVKSLELLGIVVADDGFLENLLGKVTFVL